MDPMTDQGIENSREVVNPPRLRLRWIPGAVIAACGAIAAGGATVLVPELTFQVIVLLYIALFTLVGLLIWWLCFSGVSWPVRLGGLLAVSVAVFTGLKLTVAEVTFDGAMRPQIRWVWQPSARRVAEQWIAQQGTSASATLDDDESFSVSEVDWPQFCGPGGNRVVREPVPELNWSESPPRELWRHPVGAAWSSFAIVGKRVYTQEQREQHECVVCYDADTGGELWRREDTARYETPMGGLGPRATPAVTDQRLYALGATGILNCLHPVTGELIWQRNVCEDAGSQPLEWGMSGSPFIRGETVVIDAGGSEGRAVIAYACDSGDIVWSVQSHHAGYATPRVERIGGEEQLLIFHGDGLLSLHPDTGARLWEYPWTNMYRINVAQPIRFDDHILISSGYDSGCVLLDPTRLQNGRPAEVWPPNKNLKLKFNEAASLGHHVYGLDDGILCCLDARTGERAWKGGRYRFGQVLRWGDRLVISAESGLVALVKASPVEYTELARFQALNDRTWNVPAIHDGRLYIRNAWEAACFDLVP